MSSRLSKTTRLSDRAFVMAGWWLFVICALFFCASSWRAGDGLAFAGSLTFLAANISFMIPLYRNPTSQGAGEAGSSQDASKEYPHDQA
ncbi:MAG: hypothetical protein AAFR93_10345 [Pseudomonadota bacterium]